jgi:DNA polymerase (family 10)
MSERALSNDEVAAAFDEIAERLLLQGESWFKVRAYRRGAEVIRAAAEPVALLSAEGRLAALPGVGKAIAEKTAALLTTGAIPLLERLRAETPDGLLPLLRAGVPPSVLRTLWQRFDVRDEPSLGAALAAGRLDGEPKLRRAAEQALGASARSADGS